MDTVLEFCKLCGEQFDYLPQADKDMICDECIEMTCERCGEETGFKTIGDETYNYCLSCCMTVNN